MIVSPIVVGIVISKNLYRLVETFLGIMHEAVQIHYFYVSSTEIIVDEFDWLISQSSSIDIFCYFN